MSAVVSAVRCGLNCQGELRVRNQLAPSDPTRFERVIELTILLRQLLPPHAYNPIQWRLAPRFGVPTLCVYGGSDGVVWRLKTL